MNNIIRWGITPRIRQDIVDEVEGIALDTSLHPLVRLKAIDTIVKMEAMNQIDERENGPEGRVLERTVLLIPSNGSEKKRAEAE